MRFAKSISDSATLDGSSELSTLPRTAIQRVQPRDIWRTYDNTDQYLTFNFLAVTEFNFVAVLYHNADESALWRIRTADTEANLTASPDYDSGTMSMRGSGDENRYHRFHCIKDIGTQSNQWAQLDFTTLGGVTRLDVGRVMICNAMTKAPAYGWQVVPIEDAIVIPTISGMWANTGRRRREVNITLPGATDEVAFADTGELDFVGYSRPLVMAVDETDTERQTDTTFYGTITAASNVYEHADINFKQYSFSEFERP